MTIIATFDGSNLSIDDYEKVLASDPDRITDQPERLHHVCYRKGDGFVVVDVWTSAEALATAAQTVLGPAMQAAGLSMPEPEIHEVHAMLPGSGRSSTNVATVMAMYEAFGRGDVGFILDNLDDDVEWDHGQGDHGIPWLRPRRGRDDVAGFFAVLGESLAFEVFEPREPLTNGNQVVVPVRAKARVLATGRYIDEDPELHLWTFGADGRVTGFRHFADTAAHAAATQG